MATEGNSLGQSLLRDYGNYLSEYHGKGVITLEDGKKCECLFEAGQLTNGQVLLLCDFLPPLPIYLNISATKFEGTTSKGFRIWATGAFSEVSYIPDIPIDRSLEVWAAFHIQQMTVQIAEEERNHFLHFGITNFEFIGTRPTRASDNSFYLNLPLDLQSNSRSTRLLIKPLDLNGKIMRRLRTLKSVDVSCEVIAEISADGDVAVVREVVDDLCYILSIARGTKIQWVYCDSYNAAEKLISREHSSRITKPYCPLPIIHPVSSGGKETKTFIEQVYKTYVAKRESYNLSKGTIDAYLDAKAEGDYLEMRGIKLVVAMEMLKAVVLELPYTFVEEYVITEQKFMELAHTLCTAVDDVLQKENIDKDSRKAICNDKKVLELNRRSFAHFLKKLCRHIGLKVKETEIRQFVEFRNKLVHRGRFYWTIATQEEREKYKPLPSRSYEYFFLVNFLDRVFLKLLGYSGPYIDWRIPGNPIHPDQV